ncbi:16S rRNA (uracil1498-N3)-methyltransferase [Devosia enhydra]|uniref:Ribosomal RNA small subunit methyltransferase E n=1 Tax=Devosia enhydra TaxID=665118 RepID=A0A1K2I2Y9_9HYPH|nr:16S rRNA (uracil(1498)-N(3))-methyltransferase [Devosia enhydra]SFZ86132.1 16S rRNA (uracil1498-N3)-methyltransferase [Devosia enhydra]
MPRSHASLPRLYVDFDLGEAMTATLSREHVVYLVTVLRRKEGDGVILFNGRDGAWACRLTDVSRKAVTVEAEARVADQTPPSYLWFGFAPLKVGRLDYLVQKATEMGAGIIQPVMTRFVQGGPPKPDKLFANIVEAAEQCEVLSVPRLESHVSLVDLVRDWTGFHGDRCLLFCDESALSGSPVGALQGLDPDRRVGVLIGPEGGFSDEERALLLAQPFVLPISLGPRILRADTAGVAALAVVQATIGDWR